MVRSDWISANIPIGLAEKLDKFVKSKEGKRMGFSNRNQVIVNAIRDFLEKWESSRSEK
jgi:metal-responsive CopG/Arc/MetJ family transcriptional regulator